MQKLREQLTAFFARNNLLQIIIIFALIIAASLIVYVTGGTEYAFAHVMYIPIIIAAFFYNIKGSVVTAFLGGLLLGPLMPLNVATGTIQETKSWIFRLVCFIIIGGLIGFLFRRIKSSHKLQIQNSYRYELTGFPNARKLKIDISERIREQKNFSLMIFKITNLDQINRYIDYGVGEKSLLKALEIMTECVNRDQIYSLFVDEFAVAMWGSEIEETYAKAIEFLDYFKEPVLVNGIPVSINMKGGIANYPLHGTDVDEVFKNLGRALDQGEYGKDRIAIYIDSIANEYKAKFETVASLYDAIKNDQFTIVYQPIINIKENRVKGVEALLRWNNRWGLRPDEFIQVAEDAGIICEVSKWVIKHVIDQIKEWKAQGIITKVAINISYKDLKDASIINYAASYLEKNEIDPCFIEFELTERVMIDVHGIEKLLNETKDLGIKISLDDFGTGYNSLVQFVNLPIDFLKIDKSFIDHIDNEYYRSLIREIIIMAHSLGQEVIAEGVETNEQVELLNQMGSDNIQGYYFSKPLIAAQLTEFIKQHS